jgi:N-formylglutamate amidohydrolase
MSRSASLPTPTQPLFELIGGDAPLVVNVPHAGTLIPPALVQGLTPAAIGTPDTDWHVDRLYREACAARGITLLVATHSRIVVDLKRDPSGAALYPGAWNTEICPLSTFAGEPHYRPGCEPAPEEIAARVDAYWRPYHARLHAEVERMRARHGSCALLDAHSIASVVPRLFAGRLPDLNLGTADGASCAAPLAAAAMDVLHAAHGFSAVHDGRFKGGYITRHYGRPAHGVHALQLETAQCAYLDESRPRAFDAARASAFMRLIERLLDALLAGVGELARKER